MKRLSVFLTFYVITTLCFSQRGEFQTYSNGLMYSDTTMSQLAFIVDSLNIKYKKCDLDRVYYSKLQAKAHYIRMESGDISQARKDLESNLPFDEFIKKHPKAKLEKGLLIVKYTYTNYQNIEVVKFNSVVKDFSISYEDQPKMYSQAMQGKWVFDYWGKSDYSDESLRAFYFTIEFEKTELPEKYARMIQYSYCMVDTSSEIFTEDAQRTGVRYDIEMPSKVSKFLTYVHESTNKPIYDEDNSKAYFKKYLLWDSTRVAFIDSSLSKEPKFTKLLDEAIKEALKKGGSNDEFEEYVGRYYSYETELELKRNRIVVGGCSMDNSPRIHAMNIAVLSANTVNWEVFLRAHLNIMNDRFDRASDGSYAWGARKTYIRELEELDIDVTELLLGISLRIENPSSNHYYGSIRRIGRALSESENTTAIEAKMLEMIEDNELDDYNRMIIYTNLISKRVINKLDYSFLFQDKFSLHSRRYGRKI